MKLRRWLPLLLAAPAWALSVTGSPHASPRERFGIARLEAALAAIASPPQDARILAGTLDSGLFREFPAISAFPAGEREAFRLERSGNAWLVIGSDPSGVLYGCFELARRVGESRAVAAAEAAGPYVTRNRDEYLRLLNDMRCIETMMRYYRAKTRAASLVLRYGYSRDRNDLRQALPLLEESLAQYRRLVALTDETYREACSVHSVSRRIPFLGGPGRYTHWRDCLPAYEKELEIFRRNLRLLETNGGTLADSRSYAPLPGVSVKLSGAAGELFRVEPGARIYSDRDAVVQELAPELRGLTGIRIAGEPATRQGVRVEFELPEPAQVLVGFFKSQKKGAAAAPPKDEWEPILRNALAVSSHPALTVYSHALPAGRSELDFGRGAYVVLGFIRKDAQPEPRLVFFSGSRPDLD